MYNILSILGYFTWEKNSNLDFAPLSHHFVSESFKID